MVQILKALYGLVQSAALWFTALPIFLHNLGFVAHPLDDCVLILQTKAGVLYIVLYVNDFLLLADQEIMIEWLLQGLENKIFTIVTDTADSFMYLGMIVSKEKDAIAVHIEVIYKTLWPYMRRILTWTLLLHMIYLK